MTDQPKPSEDELEQAPADRHQDEEAMRQAGHEDPAARRRVRDEDGRDGEEGEAE
jgi:hypothetical protein